MLKELTKRKIPATLGIIACELEEENNYITKLKKFGTSNKIEFALHGYYHKKNINGNPEFKGLSKNDAYKLIHAGKSIMQEKLGITPTTFIPPWNTASSGTKKALIEEGFTLFSGNKDEFEKSSLLSLGYNAATATFHPHQLVGIEELEIIVQKSLKKRDYCAIMVHPQDYLVDDVGDSHKPDIDFAKYKQFISLLDYLEKKHVNFITFNEIQGY